MSARTRPTAASRGTGKRGAAAGVGPAAGALSAPPHATTTTGRRMRRGSRTARKANSKRSTCVPYPVAPAPPTSVSAETIAAILEDREPGTVHPRRFMTTANPDSAGPDLIDVEIKLERELEAIGADVHVSIRGSSLVTGSQALRKAREVAALVKALEAVGVAEADIYLEDVRAEVTSGLLSKSSSATYSLRARATLDGLADALGAIADQKNAAIDSIAWRYPDDDDARTEWLTICATRATERARKIAAALGVKLLGVHWFAEPVAAPSPYFGAPGGAGVPAEGTSLRRRAMSASDLGLTVSHSKKVEITVRVQFRVSPVGA